MHVFEAIHLHYVLINARLLILSNCGNIFFRFKWMPKLRRSFNQLERKISCMENRRLTSKVTYREIIFQTNK